MHMNHGYMFFASLLLLVAACRDAADQASKPITTDHGEHAAVEYGPEMSPVLIDMSLGWCGGHGVPESVCTRCNASLIDKFKAGNDWCGGHGLPESQCVICNPSVEAKWAALKPGAKPANEPTPSEKDRVQLPPPTGDETGMRLERVNALGPKDNDPLCPVDALRIRFRDATIAGQVGIETEPAAMRRMSATLEAPGRIDFDQTRLAHVVPRVEGVVVEVPAALGDAVEAGEVLAVIESPRLGELKSRLIELHQRLRLAQADLERHNLIHSGVERMLEICTEDANGEDLRRELAGVRVGDFKSRLLKAHANLEVSRSAFEREDELRQQGISSQQDLDTAHSRLLAAEADFRSTREEIDLQVDREHLADETAVKVARIAWEAARRQLRIAGIRDDEINALETNPSPNLSRYEIRSPIDGRITDRHAVVGESVTEQDELFVVADLSVMWLMLDVPERDAVLLKSGQSVVFSVDGLYGRSFSGRIDWIASRIDPRTRTTAVRVPLQNQSGPLRANLFGQGRIVLHDDDSLLTIPVTAIQSDGCCQLVFVKTSDTLFEPRKIVRGFTTNGYTAIARGLDVGEPVVTTGSFLMKTEILKSSIGAGCCEVNPGR